MGYVSPKQAGWRLILLTLPFLAFGLWWAIAPPVTDALGPAAGVARALGVALALLGVGAIAFGIFLIDRGDQRVL